MDTGILDTITASFVGALQGGALALGQFSLPLLGVLAVISFYLTMSTLVISGNAGAGDALATALLEVIKIGVFYWLLVNLVPLASAAYATFLGWGMLPSGNTAVAERFVNPSLVLDVGFKVAKPLKEFVDRSAGWMHAWNYFVLLPYTVAFWIIMVSFAFVALHLMATIVEFYLAVMVATVLIPFGVLGALHHLAEFAIGWATGGLVRILVTGAIVGIAVPLFDLVQFNATGGGDPTFYSAIVVALTSGIFGILSWIIPGRAAAIAGRGMSLAVSGSTLIAGAASQARGVMVVTAAIRGASRLLGR